MSYLIFATFISTFLVTLELFAIDTMSFTVLHVFIIVFFLAFLKRSFWDGKGFYKIDNFTKKFLMLFFSVPLLSLLGPLLSGNNFLIVQSLRSMGLFYFVISMPLIIIFLPLKENLWVNIIKFFLILSIFVNIFGVYQLFARIYDLPFAWFEFTGASYRFRNQVDSFTQLSLHFENFYRATSIFTEPSALAVFNALIFMFLIIPYLQGKKLFFSKKWLNLLIGICFIPGEFLAFSLSGIACIALMILLFLIIENRKKSLKLITILLIVGGSVLFIDQVMYPYTNISVLNLFTGRIGSIYNYVVLHKTSFMMGESFETRSNNSFDMINIWLHSPLTGTGLGLTRFYSGGFLYADIGFLAILAETGFLGALFFLGFIVSFFFLSLKIRKKNLANTTRTRHLSAIQGIFPYFWTFLILQNFISGNQVDGFSMWFFIAMFISLDNIYKHEDGELQTFSIVKVPMKERFALALQAYVNNKVGNGLNKNLNEGKPS